MPTNLVPADSPMPFRRGPWRVAVCLLLAALLSACAARQDPAMNMSSLSQEYLDDLDAVITEQGPVNVDGVKLSDGEKKALNSPLSLKWDLNDYARDAIKRQFVFLHYQRGDTLRVWLDRSSRYLGYARKVFKQEGLPEELAYLPFIESGFNSIAVSSAGAMGLWQFMPDTGRRFGLSTTTYVDERRNPWKATWAAAGYLKKLHAMFGDWSLCLASYNAGEGKISRACAATGAKNFFQLALKNDTLPENMALKPETMHYVPRFIAMLKIANNAQALGYKPLSTDVVPEPEKLAIPENCDLKAMAAAIGMDWEDFRKQNAHFRLEVSPPDSQAHVYVPAQHRQQLASYLTNPVKATSKSRATALAKAEPVGKPGAKPAEAPKRGQGTTWHVAVKGDTFPKIAQRYNVPLDELLTLNAKRSKDLSAGELVALPQKAAKDALGREPIATAPLPSTKKIVEAASKEQAAKQQLAKAVGAPDPSGKAAPATAPAATASTQQAQQAQPSQPAKAAMASYVVQAGDTCFSLAKKHNCSVENLLKANGLDKPDQLRVGTSINVPKSAAPQQALAQAPAAAPPASGKAASAQGQPATPSVAQIAQAAQAAQASKNAKADTADKADAARLAVASSKADPAKTVPAGQGSPAQSNKPAKKTVYQVAQGDTIWSIARKFACSPFDILSWNNLSKESNLKPGDRIAVYVASN